MSVLFKVEGFCENERRIRQLYYREYKYSLESLNFAASMKAKQTQDEVKSFLQLQTFGFKKFQASRRILASFPKFFPNVFSNTFSQHNRTVFLIRPKCVIQRALTLSSLSHALFDTTNLYKPLPRFEAFLARRQSPNLCTETKCPEIIPEAF